MPRRITSLHVAAIALMLFILGIVAQRVLPTTADTVLTTAPQGQPGAMPNMPPPKQTGAPPTNEGCDTATAELADRLRASSDAHDAWQRLLLARGQGARVAGAPRPPGTATNEAKVRHHANDLLPADATIESVDCSEWPCILLATYPNQEHPHPKAISGSDIRISSTWGARVIRDVEGNERHEGTVHQAMAAYQLDEGSNELSTRMQFRFQRARAESEGGFTPSLAPPSLPRTAPDDPCGRDASAMRWVLDDPEAALPWLGEATRYHESVHAFVSGEVVASPEQLDPRYRETAVREAGSMVADVTGLELVDVDCTEHPCMASLAGRAPEGADLEATRRALVAAARRAVEEAGYPPDQAQLLPGTVSDTGELALWITLHPPGERPDSMRSSARRDENGWPTSTQVFDPVD